MGYLRLLPSWVSLLSDSCGPYTWGACPAIPCGWQRFGFIRPHHRRGVSSSSSAEPPPCAGHCQASLPGLVILPSRAGQGRCTGVRPRAIRSRPIRGLGGGAVSGVGKVHAGFLEETDWEPALEG